MTLEDILATPPYNFEGVEQFRHRYAKEVWFIMRNNLKCPRCQKHTRMAKVHCQQCGGNMGISNVLFDVLVNHMMYEN